MAVPSSLFVKLSMSEEMYGLWLASPIKFIGDYSDWPDMNPAMASRYKGWRDETRPDEYMSVMEFLDNIADYARHFCYGYDDAERAARIAYASHSPKVEDVAATVAALRGAADFIDGPSPGFIYVFPFASGGDPEALLRLERGRSEFLRPSDSSPDTLCFVNEAEEFIEAMLEDGE
ncbi:MAG: hypothetical protein LBQ36_08450 [Synergistaceae bacterium]|nr:hypothetical protein [Synergistaceae bacterium]